MPSNKVDPRVIRTKQLLVEAFLNVSQEKEMTQITVKNITDRATVNRATFYAHFNDKYEILDYSLSMTILKDIKEALSISETLNGQIISKLFVSIAYYLENVQNACKLNRETFCNHAHKCINNELEDIFTLMLQHKYPEHDSSIIENSASFLAAGLCGLARHWLDTSELSAEQFIDQNLPFLLHHITNL
ncbi:TetR family transcriptional regulator [Staphylococcus hominis]|uniref:TetR/AcrR family transcriptional regulator n=1 Tax=Staphylococcus hominis TaxID=1290 RepID=UPI0007D8E397|nr:TetR/AcrR family transcriptional regulator [Staphylococcus hominis]MCI2847289.1 TetR/AcrR family transcriptional regulator [Staphylococcus hominis]MCI2849382.1 TetR/AcrR family transcriptional regulator [Staphylococcus hominis]MCI2856211.1 TetR/AcrR family transcriptional regulator [Staphylococcus hominis]MCI2886456.1 TetR/AcrR family transcriptional regulator [Staphylococcus hominis]MDS3887659.1 TetR/AcrR family transcriptional regulator [Staphylococcus hominis]